MTTVLVNFKFNNLNFFPVSATPYQSHYEGRVDTPLEDLDLSEAFRGVQNDFQLKVGDQVTICSYYDNSWNGLAEVGVCRIVGQERGNNRANKTIAQWIGPIAKIDRKLLEGVDVKSKRRRELTRKKEFGGGFVIQDEKGNTIERVKTKAEADDYIKRINEG